MVTCKLNTKTYFCKCFIMLKIAGDCMEAITCKIKHFYNILRPRHSRGKSTALKHFCKYVILHVTTVLCPVFFLTGYLNNLLFCSECNCFPLLLLLLLLLLLYCYYCYSCQDSEITTLGLERMTHNVAARSPYIRRSARFLYDYPINRRRSMVDIITHRERECLQMRNRAMPRIFCKLFIYTG